VCVCVCVCVLAAPITSDKHCQKLFCLKLEWENDVETQGEATGRF